MFVVYSILKDFQVSCIMGLELSMTTASTFAEDVHEIRA
jgi:hypothetical protein